MTLILQITVNRTLVFLNMLIYIVYCVVSSTFLDTAVIVIESTRLLTMAKRIAESSRYLWDAICFMILQLIH
jgi:hypothetical protein